MGALIPVGLRGLVWLATAFGLGSWFGGDKIENQVVIQSTPLWEKILWIACGGVLIVGIVFLIRYLIKRKKRR